MVLTVALGIGLLALMTFIGLRVEAFYNATLAHHELPRPGLSTVYLATVLPYLGGALVLGFLLRLLVGSTLSSSLDVRLAGGLFAASVFVMGATLAAAWAQLQRRHLVVLDPVNWTPRGGALAALIFLGAFVPAAFLAFAARLAIPADVLRTGQALGWLPGAAWLPAFGNTVLLIAGIAGVVCTVHLLAKLGECAIRLHKSRRLAGAAGGP